MRSKEILLGVLLAAAGCSSCINVRLPEIALPELGGVFAPDTTFVVHGTAEAVEANGSCLVWRADDGRAYVLFQSSRLANELFDTVTTPGTPSRLELTVRTDLGPPCRGDATVAEVTKILEIDGADVAGLIVEFEDSVTAFAEAARAAAATIGEDLEARVAVLITDFEARVAEAREESEGRAEEFQQAVDDATAELRSRLEEAAEGRRAQFEEALGALLQELQDSLPELIDRLLPDRPGFGRG